MNLSVPTPRTSLLLGLVVPVLVSGGCNDDRSGGRQLIVLGFDGLDPELCREMMNQGRLPNMARLRDAGGFKPLGTSTPPQSPVAWCTLITGTNPGMHGIFDFIHRDPKTYQPYPSTAETRKVKRWYGGLLPDYISLGDYRFELLGREVVNLRRGKPFWEYLTESGIPAQIYRMPANYPPAPSKGADFTCLSDMGTPDVRGTQGMFSFYTDVPPSRRIHGGGSCYPIRFVNNKAEDALYGPTDTLLNPDNDKTDGSEPRQPVRTALTIYRDPTEPTTRLVWDDQQVVLAQGEWSDWHRVEFKRGPRWAFTDSPILPTTKAICRFYLKQVRPVFQLYVSPLNIDPLDPCLPISQPEGFATEVAEALGRYYTQGLPEDTQALVNGVLTPDEFLHQADLVLAERLELLDYALEHFESGLLFFYFGTTDQVAHMFWGARDPDHPALSAVQKQRYAAIIEDLYERMDAMAAKVMQRFPKATIMLLSDHGFSTFKRQFNPNNWLLENGYAVKRDPRLPPGVALNFAFRRTRAYARGVNGLYVNLQGREKNGIVPPAGKQALMDEIAEKLLKYRDPETGEQVITEVYQADKVYSGPQIALGPDMQIGYNRGYRVSWNATLAGFDEATVSDNTDAWNADHCIATDLVPGLILANRPLPVENPTLEDIAPTILAWFGLEVPAHMKGRCVFDAEVSLALRN